jgi:hypothetical protein
MRFSQIRNIVFLAASAAGLSACTIYDGYGAGAYGDRYASKDYPDECYDKEGYLYEDCEDAGYVARNGYGYGSVFYHNSYGPYGWYDGFYYPGYSTFIYDRRGQRFGWGELHRRHWEGQRHARRADGGRRGQRRDRDVDNRGERRSDRRGHGRRGDNGQAIAPGTGRSGPYPGVAPQTPRQNSGGGGGGGRQGRAPEARGNTNSAPRQANPAPAPTTERPTNNRTRQTQRMRRGPSEEHPE